MRFISFRHYSHRSHKRPFGVSVIIFLLVLYVLLLGITLFSLTQVPMGEITLWMAKSDNPIIIGIFFLAAIVFEASVAIGLWLLLRWAWVLIMIQVGSIMLSDLWGYFSGYPSYITMIISVIAVFYLNQREVQMAFSGAKISGARTLGTKTSGTKTSGPTR